MDTSSGIIPYIFQSYYFKDVTFGRAVKHYDSDYYLVEVVVMVVMVV